MKKLEQEDKERISQILYNNWENIFGLLNSSITDKDGVPYKETYKHELKEMEKDLPDLINMYLENRAFFNRDSMKDWLVKEVIAEFLGDIDCRRYQFCICVNQLYDMVFRIIKPYYTGLYPEKKNVDVKKVRIIETNLGIKDGSIFDYQSRVIEVNSWEGYVQEYKEYNKKTAGNLKVSNDMLGISISKDMKILNLIYDSFHLS